MQKRYYFIRFFAGLLKVLAIVVLLVSILAAVFVFTMFTSNPSVYDNLGTLLGFQSGFSMLLAVVSAVVLVVIGILTCVSIFAQAELYNLYIALEENTRATSLLLESRK